MPNILITRTQPGADRLAKQLEADGFASLVCPLLVVEPVLAPSDEAKDAQGFILTSAAAIAALPDPAIVAERPVFCVGAETARQTSQAGYQNVTSAKGSGKSMARLIEKAIKADGGKLHWCRGEVADETLLRHLSKARFLVSQQICYRTVSLSALPTNIRKALANGTIDAVVFHSKRGAECFRRLKPELAVEVKLLAFSEQIADVLQRAGWSEVSIAKKPNEASMIATLRQMFSLS
ncbi:MAG: hypothetical protein COA47_09165 [Robiginitomaculum sp.]|nr:MAG: hypothetical protein COA47_09165 [Robiginitomaculum sp.]